MPEKPAERTPLPPAAADAPWTPDPKHPNWTEQDQRDAEEFARGFVALMLYARTVGITVGFCMPTAPAKTSEGGIQE
jgi:hypothetical protein